MSCRKPVNYRVVQPYKMYIKSQVNLFDSTAFFSSHSNIINLAQDNNVGQSMKMAPVRKHCFGSKEPT
ncbi:hypothetical protein ECA4156 [Pectobacterium atrosepticum SCRI1043]|uniref:Uncharacterized protein n=1 Tax=Pectobacterium atrosepticum (strain SCRI 1043 / ATCC BAA-672) TaxID=218491 RepID=Q6CZJ5_PECAS|nr:hypothetical protein [Pectobacterium atrosepticum]MCL6322937.1 hypothetical protein [Pectobacterium atrosepticum]MCL6392040.1 hypothetical protein [Pectobacterium atrosepticum]QXE15078.1 hypothetical protein DCX48_11470 [Pectobacterium atrosepticum]CAG77053.1 hypothetical protein ECA4156 [Pectobacterium atrosepticum SCRI1043]